MREELLEAWRTAQRVNLYLIDHISRQGMRCRLSKRGGRDVAGRFAHLHNGCFWSLDRRAPDLAAGLEKLPPKTSPTDAELRSALRASGREVEELLSGCLAGPLA